jgi:hypothetical protein
MGLKYSILDDIKTKQSIRYRHIQRKADKQMPQTSAGMDAIRKEKE